MNRKIKLMSLFVLAVFFFSAVPAFAVDGKFASVNVGKVLNGYAKTKDNERILQEAGKKKEQERDGLVQSVRQLKDELTLVSDDARAKKQQALDAKVRELQDFDLQAKQELGEKRNTILREILKDIDETVKSYGERKGLDYVMSENALLYYNPKYDATQEILDELNKEYPKKKK
ncbi:MAG TPA: OmpH family outer membrane protein [bacterium]|nr:OmpH family outer membrane protein [bacterium]